MDELTVKARKRQGTNSLDLTIPTSIVKSLGLSPGDIFKVITSKNGDKLKIEYEEIYRRKK